MVTVTAASEGQSEKMFKAFEWVGAVVAVVMVRGRWQWIKG